MPHSISEQDVRHVAKLSRLRLTDQEVKAFTDQLSAVLTYMTKLNELDVDHVEPMAHPTAITNVLREDEPTPGMPVEAALANAPVATPPFFRAPKVLGDGGGA